jgi:hypothetical protein
MDDPAGIGAKIPCHKENGYVSGAERPRVKRQPPSVPYMPSAVLLSVRYPRDARYIQISPDSSFQHQRLCDVAT